jgi:hypothetical protein
MRVRDFSNLLLAMIKIYDRRRAEWKITYAAAPRDFTIGMRGSAAQGKGEDERQKSIYQGTRKGLERKKN